MQIQAIIETAIYVDDLDATERFYHHVLGLRVIAKEAGRHVFFQAGPSSVLLAFIAEATLKGDHLPSHGAKGFRLEVREHLLNGERIEMGVKRQRNQRTRCFGMWLSRGRGDLFR